MVAVTAAEQAVAPALTPNAGGPASRQHSRALAESTAVGNGGAWIGARSRGQQGDGGRAEESLAVAVTRPAHVGIDLGDPAEQAGCVTGAEGKPSAVRRDLELENGEDTTGQSVGSGRQVGEAASRVGARVGAAGSSNSLMWAAICLSGSAAVAALVLSTIMWIKNPPITIVTQWA